MRLLRAFSVGGSAPKPPGFTAFFPPEWAIFAFSQGDRLNLSPAFPAAQPVARVASQHCPIPSGSGRLIINYAVRLLNEKAANGKYPLNFVSHNLGAPQSREIPPPPICLISIPGRGVLLVNETYPVGVVQN
jgi:hypothetical protein